MLQRMSDWWLRLLFPRQHETLKHISNPDFVVYAPEGVYLKSVRCYLETEQGEGTKIVCQWIE